MTAQSTDSSPGHTTTRYVAKGYDAPLPGESVDLPPPDDLLDWYVTSTSTKFKRLVVVWEGRPRPTRIRPEAPRSTYHKSYRAGAGRMTDQPTYVFVRELRNVTLRLVAEYPVADYSEEAVAEARRKFEEELAKPGLLVTVDFEGGSSFTAVTAGDGRLILAETHPF